MPLKPNVLEDLARDVSYLKLLLSSAVADIQHWIAPPAPRPKFYSAQDAVHLEDESGRVRLVGNVIKQERDRLGGGLVTGAPLRSGRSLTSRCHHGCIRDGD